MNAVAEMQGWHRMRLELEKTWKVGSGWDSKSPTAGDLTENFRLQVTLSYKASLCKEIKQETLKIFNLTPKGELGTRTKIVGNFY